MLAVGAELFHTDGRTGRLADMTKLLVTFRNFTKAHENISDKSCIENQNTHFLLNNIFFFFRNHVVYEIMWNNILQLAGHS